MASVNVDQRGPADTDRRIAKSPRAIQGSEDARRDGGANQIRWYSPRNISGVYALLLTILIFGLASPDSFFTVQSAKTILNQSAVSGIVALALVVPLAAGVFDISVGYTLGFSGVVAAWMLGNWSMSVVEIVLLTLLVGAVVGLANAFVVLGLRVDAIVATLGTGSLLYGLTEAVSGDLPLTTGVAGSFSYHLAGANFEGITVPVFVMLALMVVLGLATEQTQVGRFCYAVGIDVDVARLSGIRVRTIKVGALIIGGLLATLAGLCLTAQVQAGTPTAGPAYLLPAFAGVFLGATQFRAPRFNAWGTVLAVLFLATGNYGLLLVGGPTWLPQVFNGLALILAVALAGVGGSRASIVGLWRRLTAQASTMRSRRGGEEMP
jgi:ribose transport system permease protein